MAEPTDKMRMLFAVIFVPDARGHIDHSFDELGFLEVRHGVVAPHELGSSQAIAVLQRWNVAGLGGKCDEFTRWVS
jgi:hypothetical protein